MRVDRILQVADAIERRTVPDLGFNMGYDIYRRNPSAPGYPLSEDRTGRGCGTVACIAGWSYILRGRYDVTEVAGHCVDFDDIGQWLGLHPDQSSALFYAYNSHDVLMRDLTDAQAVAVLRYLAEHGVVDWDRVITTEQTDEERDG